MKKVITLALALLMICSMSVPAFAATTTLTTTVPDATYTLNIPSNREIPFGSTKVDIGNITVTDSSGFAVGKNLDVTITYDSFIAEGINTQIPYTLSLYADGEESYVLRPAQMEVASGATITFEGKADGSTAEAIQLDTVDASETTTGKVSVTNIYFEALSADWGKALAGEYSTTITFTAEVVAE